MFVCVFARKFPALASQSCCEVSRPRVVGKYEYRLLRLEKKFRPNFFCVRQVYFTKSCQQIWVRVNQPFITFIRHIWGETVLWSTVFIIQTSDNRMQYFTILRYKLLFRTIEARVGFSRKRLKKFSKSSIRPAGSDFYSASSGECLNEH